MSGSASAAAIKRKRPVRLSLWNLVLLCVASLGIGMLWGYQIFYASYVNVCQNAMLEQEVAILNNCKAKYEKKGRTECAQEGKADTASLHQALQESEKALFQLQGSIQRRAQSECLRRYGQPPYVVEIWFSTNDKPDEYVLPIELSHVNEMPFTTDTFFQLIEYGLYAETSLGPQQGMGVSGSLRNMIGGNPSDAPTRVRTQLLRNYAELGYGTTATPFVLDESASSSSSSSARRPCGEPNSFGFVSQGPEFTIFTSPPNDHISVQCIGRVLPDGQRALDVLQSLPGPDSARIIEVRIQGVEEERGQEGRVDEL